MKTYLAAVLALVGLLLSGNGIAANLFTNPSFTTDATGWTLTGGCVPAAFDASGNPGGSILLNSCGESGSNPMAAQSVSGLTPLAGYRVGWEDALHVNISANGASFGLFINGVLATTVEDLGGSFVAHTFDFIAATATTSFGFAGEVDPTDVSYFLDNVSLTLITAVPPAVPEPGSLALLGLGIAGLFVSRKRRHG